MYTGLQVAAMDEDHKQVGKGAATAPAAVVEDEAATEVAWGWTWGHRVAGCNKDCSTSTSKVIDGGQG